MENNTERLLYLLKTFDSRQVRDELHGLDEDEVLSGLIYILKNDENSSNRVLVANVLGELGNRKAIQPLIEAFKDRPVWPFAVRALSKFNDPSLIEPMILSMIGPSVAIGFSLPLVPIIKTILTFGEPAFQALLNHLDDPALRPQITQALGMSRDPRAIKPLIRMLSYPIAGPIAAMALLTLNMNDLQTGKLVTQLLHTDLSDIHRDESAKKLESLLINI